MTECPFCGLDLFTECDCEPDYKPAYRFIDIEDIDQ